MLLPFLFTGKIMDFCYFIPCIIRLEIMFCSIPDTISCTNQFVHVCMLACVCVCMCVCVHVCVCVCLCVCVCVCMCVCVCVLDMFILFINSKIIVF